MRRAHGVVWLLALVLLWAAPPAAASMPATFEQRLLEADKLRSSDPKRFAILLDELDAAARQASQVQRQRLPVPCARTSRWCTVNEPEQGIALAKECVRGGGRMVDLRFRAGSLLANSYALTRDFHRGAAVPQSDACRCVTGVPGQGYPP